VAQEGTIAVTAGEYSSILTKENNENAITANNNADATTEGNFSLAMTAGVGANASTKGGGSHAITGSDFSHTSTRGGGSHAITAGYKAGAITEGEHSHAITAETASCAYVKGKNSIACALGRDAWVRGELGSWLVATEWEYSEDAEKYMLRSIATGKVDGEKIKPNRWYKAQNGQLVDSVYSHSK